MWAHILHVTVGGCDLGAVVFLMGQLGEDGNSMPAGEEMTSIIEGKIEVIMEFKVALEVQNEIRREELRRPRAGEPLRDIVSTLFVRSTQMHSMVAKEQMQAQRKILRLPTMGQSIDEGSTNKGMAHIRGVQLISRYAGSEHMPD